MQLFRREVANGVLRFRSVGAGEGELPGLHGLMLRNRGRVPLIGREGKRVVIREAALQKGNGEGRIPARLFGGDGAVIEGINGLNVPAETDIAAVKITPGPGIAAAGRNRRKQALVHATAVIDPYGVDQAALHKEVERDLPEPVRDPRHGDQVVVAHRLGAADIADAVNGTEALVHIEVAGDLVVLFVHFRPAGHGADKSAVGVGLDHADAVKNVGTRTDDAAHIPGAVDEAEGVAAVDAGAGVADNAAHIVPVGA